MSSIEDRLWSDLVDEHGGKLAETTWPSPKSYRRRPLVLGGSALVVAGAATALVLGFTGTTSSPAYRSPQYAAAARVPASSLTYLLNTNAIVAQATIGDTRFVVAPGTGAQATELCFAVSGRLPGSGGASGMMVCGSRTSVGMQGSGASATIAGKTTVWGFAPQGTTAATVGGRPVRLVGRFYEVVLPPGVHNVVFRTPTGKKMTGDLGARSR